MQYFTKENPKYTREDVIQAVNNFHAAHGRYPAFRDFKPQNGLPHAKTIQRRFGGLVEFKQSMGISEPDTRKGSHRSHILRRMARLCRESENAMYEFLKSKYGEVCVHRDYKIFDDTKFNIDFAVHIMNSKNEIERIDFYECFYPSDRHSFIGCLNIKIKKYARIPNRTIPHTVTYVQMNPNLKDIQSIVDKRKVKINGAVCSVYDIIR